MSARDQAKLSWTCLKLFPTIIIRSRPFGTMVIEGGKFSKFCPVDEIFFVPWHFLSKLRFLASRSYSNLLVSTWNLLCLLLIWAQLSKYVKFEKHERLVMSQRWLISLTGWKKSVPWQLWSPVTRLNFIFSSWFSFQSSSFDCHYPKPWSNRQKKSSEVVRDDSFENLLEKKAGAETVKQNSVLILWIESPKSAYIFINRVVLIKISNFGELRSPPMTHRWVIFFVPWKKK